MRPSSYVALGMVAFAIAIIFSGQTRNAYVTITDPDGNELEAGLNDTLFLDESGSVDVSCNAATDTCTWTATVTGAGAVTLDLGDDDVNESVQIDEIAVTGDDNNIITEPEPDKVLFDFSNAVPLADALAANPADCAATNFATTIAANGDLTCAQPNFTDLAGAATDAQVPNTITIDLAATATALAADPSDCAADTKADSIAVSGNLTCSAVDTGDITDGTILEADLAAVDAAVDEECLTYESTGGDFEWQSCSAGSGDITDVGDCSTGACLTADGTGSTIYLEGTGVDAFEQIIGTDNPTADRTFNFPDDQIADDDFLLGDGAGSLIYVAAPDCDDSGGNHLNYDQGANSITCGTSSSVTDTSAATACAGSTTYLDGEGGCDTLDGLEDFEPATDDGLPVGNGASFDTVVVPDCDDSSGNHINYDTGTNAFSCGTTSSVTQPNLFETFDAPQGDDPVADSATDTLLFIASQGTIGITGSAAGDSLEWFLYPSGIGEPYLKVVDAPSDEECLTYEDTVGDFEWQTCSPGGGGTLTTIQEDDSTVGDPDIVTLDFGAGFDLLESPDTEINISIDIEEGFLPDDALWVGATTGAAAIKFVADCDDSGGNHLNYDTTTNAFSCGTSSSVTDTGPGPDCAGTTTYQDGEGGCDTLDGVEDFETATDDGVLVGTGAVFDTVVVADCDDSGGNHLNYDTGTNAFSCGTSNSSVDQNLFETITPPQGDAPVADSTTDTLLLIASQGTVGITGSAAGDSLEWFLYPGGISEQYLDSVDAAADEECLTYEADNPEDFEWQTCGGSDQNLFETVDVPVGTDPVAASTTDTLTILAESGGGVSFGITGSASNTITIGVFGEQDIHASEHSSTGDDRIYIPRAAAFPQLGTIAVEGTTGSEVGKIRFEVDFNFYVTDTHCSLGTAPTGASAIFDINYNGTTIYTTQGNRPTITAGSNEGVSGTPDTTLLAAGGYMDIDFDQVGSTIAGADLMCQVRGRMEVFSTSS